MFDEDRSQDATIFNAGQPIRAWTRAEKQTVREKYPTGISVEAIAQELDRTVSSVKSMANKLGIARPGSNTTRGYTTDKTPDMQFRKEAQRVCVCNGNEREIARLYRGQKYQDCRLKQSKGYWR